MNGRVGQYEMVSRDSRRQLWGRNLRVVVYGAYNAMGLIGPEDNGIAILDEGSRSVVIDGHVKENSGYFGPSVRQIEEFARIMSMEDAELEEFIESHPRKR